MGVQSRKPSFLNAPFLTVVVGATLAMSAGALSTPAGARTSCTVSSNPRVDGVSPVEGICRYLESREGVVQVALFNHRTGRFYALSTGPNKQLTASVVKVDILAEWLHRYQRRRVRIPRQIPYSIKYLMERMIESSDNAAATALFYFHGGCENLSRFNELFPLRATTVACQSRTYYGWGNTTTTATDQVTLMKVLAYGRRSDILGRDGQRYALGLMRSVDPDQRWGISCGPWETPCSPPTYAHPVPSVTVALKNGWKTLPTCTKPIRSCPWQVNSTGFVHGQGRDYVLTVLTTRDPVGTGDQYGFNYGVDTIQNVSERIWRNLQ